MKAVIPAAGLGTRLLPATKAQPKEMLPVYDKPTIQYVIEEALKSGIDDIVVVTGRNKRSIEDHFDKSYELEYTLQKSGKDRVLKQVRKITDLADICYVRQRDLNGLGDAILSAERHIDGEAFAVLLGDSITKGPLCTKGLLDVYERYGQSTISIREVPNPCVDRYGIVSGSEVEENVYKINTLIEDLQKEGYSLVKIDNKFANPKEDTHYKGVHLDFMSPRHLVFEIQVHTLESYLAKNSMHDYYKITRDMSNKYSKKEKLNARLIQKRVFDMLTDIPVFYQSHSIV